MTDDDELIVYGILKPASIDRVEEFEKYGRSKREEFKRRKRKKNFKNGFKKDFLEHFGLDKDKFSVNIVKMDDRWMVEICNRETRKCVKHDYEMLCGIMDRNCRLPESLVGFNINLEV